MPLTMTERYGDPDDPNEPYRRLSMPESTAIAPSPYPWLVEPDYQAIPGDADLPDGDELYLVWPGPALVLPAGILPDGHPYGRDELDNAERIQGVRPSNAVEADAVVRAFMRQQRTLRRQLGLPRAQRVPPHYQQQDTADTLRLIEQLHRREAERRRATASPF